MPNLEYFTPVDADLQTIWSVLLDRIENPARYMAGVESCRFIENEPDYTVREVTVQGTPLIERISIDERQGEVIYQLVNHPLFSGRVVHALIPPASDDLKAKPVVRFRMEWEPLNEEAQAIERESHTALEEGLKQGVHYVRDLAEHMEKTPKEA